MTDARGPFENRKIVPEKLIAYGFLENDGGYSYTTALMEGQFALSVAISPLGEVGTTVTDTATGEEYALHLVSGATGAFVGAVRAAYEAALADIVNRCSERDVFKTSDARAVIRYIAEKYGDEPEYLWDKFPHNAVFRIAENQKWYAALLRVEGAKLGLATEALVEILDLKGRPEEIVKLIDNESYFSGYHMNKKHWYTIPLNGRVATEELFARIDASHAITTKGGRGLEN